MISKHKFSPCQPIKHTRQKDEQKPELSVSGAPVTNWHHEYSGYLTRIYLINVHYNPAANQN